MATSEMFLTVKLSGNLKKRLEQLKKFAEKKLKESQAKENRTFLKYILCANALGNHFKLKKDLSLHEKEMIVYKCECGTTKELKLIWKEYMGFDWKGD